MKKEIILSLTNDFESYAHKTEQGIEFWFARDMQHLLDYTEWRNFLLVIDKAKITCETAKQRAFDHFVDVNKTLIMPKEAKKEVRDIMLTRYACYLIAQNGDPRKERIAFAQNYFAIQTRKFEVIEQRIKDWERLSARQKLTMSEKELSDLIFERTSNEKNFAIIRSNGDFALFGGYNTKCMKKKLNIPDKKPLADFLPTITIKAKDFAAEITVFNIKEKDLTTQNQISNEHVKNNQSVRDVLLKRGIKPEKLPREEDVKKLERRLKNNNQKEIHSTERRD